MSEEQKKLTGREAVIALLDGKKIRAIGAEPYFYLSKDKVLLRQMPDKPFEDCRDLGYSLDDVLRDVDWEIVPEPMVWGSEILLNEIPISPDYTHCVVPIRFHNKRVRIRIEEII